MVFPVTRENPESPEDLEARASRDHRARRDQPLKSESRYLVPEVLRACPAISDILGATAKRVLSVPWATEGNKVGRASQENKGRQDLVVLPSRASQEKTVIRDCQACGDPRAPKAPKARLESKASRV